MASKKFLVGVRDDEQETLVGVALVCLDNSTLKQVQHNVEKCLNKDAPIGHPSAVFTSVTLEDTGSLIYMCSDFSVRDLDAAVGVDAWDRLFDEQVIVVDDGFVFPAKPDADGRQGIELSRLICSEYGVLLTAYHKDNSDLTAVTQVSPAELGVNKRIALVPQTATFRRTWESNVSATLKFKVEDELSEIDFERKLIAAVTNWLVAEPDARDQFGADLDDLNIGDLLNLGSFSDENFQKHLADQGLYEVSAFDAEAIAMTYDIVLFDEDALDQAPAMAGPSV